MKTKTQYSLTVLSLLSLMAINYYVSSSTVKYDISKKEEVRMGEDKKIDKVEIKETQKQIVKKSAHKKMDAVVRTSAPSLFELSNQLGAPILTETETIELSYPE
jgi:predicted methyltransferase MtxX (methanogen marker protein 4)